MPVLCLSTAYKSLTILFMFSPFFGDDLLWNSTLSEWGLMSSTFQSHFFLSSYTSRMRTCPFSSVFPSPTLWQVLQGNLGPQVPWTSPRAQENTKVSPTLAFLLRQCSRSFSMGSSEKRANPDCWTSRHPISWLSDWRNSSMVVEPSKPMTWMDGKGMSHIKTNATNCMVHEPSWGRLDHTSMTGCSNNIKKISFQDRSMFLYVRT